VLDYWGWLAVQRHVLRPLLHASRQWQPSFRLHLPALAEATAMTVYLQLKN
jgi:hypothetical protein